MNESYVKLYRKIKDNPILRDARALQVFIWLLTNVDRKTGELSFGRYTAARELGVKPSTFRDALSRLQDSYNVTTIVTDSKKTTARLLHWADYQESQPSTTSRSDSKPTAGRQQTDTVTRIENIYTSTNVEVPQKDQTVSKHPYQALITYCREKQGISQEFVNYVKQTTACKKILSSGYSEDDVKFVIDEMITDPYWQSNPFDLMAVANNMHKYMNRTVMFKKGGKNAYN